MATIDGTSFNLRSFTLTSVHRNQHMSSVGADTNLISDMGYDGLQINIEGFETSSSDYDTVVDKFLSEGEHSLVIDTGWEYKTYSAQMNRNRPPGHTSYFPYSISMRTVDPYQYTTSTTTRSKSITSDGQTWNQDDSSNDIDTSGTVSAKPDIRITAESTAFDMISQTNKF